MADASGSPAISRLSGALRPDLIRSETLPEVFGASARTHAGRTALALIGAGQTLTYAELDRQSTQVAAALRARGIGEGQFVGLWFRRSLDLHVAMLGILKSGAAFIPFDADAPAERVEASLTDCGATVLLSHAAMADAPARTGATVLDLRDLLAAAPAAAALPPPPSPESPAYAIYTSGSTGKPKGIVVRHRNICHYLRAGNEVLAITADDVVLQQASVAFDLSMEEIFVPYLVGATLKVAGDDTIKQTDRLADILEQEGITVIDTVPTLLSMLERDVEGVRLIIVGGEACPPAIVERFARAGRRLVNTYGPTETTVVATAIDLVPGEPVTIGRPIANYIAYVVDDELRPVPAGTTGELLIGGPGVAAGYINLPDMTAAKFIANPFDPATSLDPVLYRTGDAVSVDGEGRIAFHGRIDAQVKIRGYRIELGEIETLITDEPGVRTAAVAVAKHPTAGDMLVAHVVAAAGSFDTAAARQSLSAKLPSYMIPPLWQVHEDDLPRLASGKVDRAALARLPIVAPVADGAEQETPGSITEAHLLKAAKDILGLPVVGFDADFFNDLGGNSLLAARFVSEVRKVPHLSGIALQDVYSTRSLRKLAGILDERAATQGNERADLSFEPPPFRRRFLCGLAQAIALPFIIAIVTVQWIGLLLSSIYLVREDAPLWKEVLILCLIFAGLNLGTKVLVVVLKWLIIGRVKPGVYPLWGTYYFRIWLMQRIVHLTMHKFLQGSPLMRIYLRCLGARIGRDAIINEFEEGTVDLISIGDRVALGAKVKFANIEVIGNEMHIGRITIGADAYIGNASVIGHDVEVGEGAEIGDLTHIPAGAKIGAWERWDGSPSRRTGMVDRADLPVHPQIGPVARALQTVGYFFTYNLMMMIGLLPIFPAFYVLSSLDELTFGARSKVVPWEWVFMFAWPAALVLVVVSMAVIIVMRWVLFPLRVKPGSYSIYSWFYFRKWSITLATETMLETLNSLYATVFMRNWYRMMGTKVGRGTEISSNFAGRYDLIELGKDNFLGDELIIGDEDIRGGYMRLGRVKTGDRVFFGNLAVVPIGAVIENDALIGVKSRLPDSLHVKSGETWFGSPAIPMPNRQKVQMTDNWTYQPPWHMRMGRMTFEALHTSFPTAVLITMAYIMADMLEFPIDSGDWTSAILLFLAAGIITSFVMFLLSVIAKWVFMGVYRPVMKPMWSWWAMRTEAVAVLYGGLSSKVLLDYLRGTPFMGWLLRLYGTKIGRGTWINSADITEFDCITVGDFAVINMMASPQTHLYEDRVMKVGSIEIGRGVTLGTAAVLLYDTKIGDFARIEPLSVVMKGEFIPPNTVWTGAPVRRMPVVSAEPIAQPVELPPLAAGEHA